MDVTNAHVPGFAERQLEQLRLLLRDVIGSGAWDELIALIGLFDVRGPERGDAPNAKDWRFAVPARARTGATEAEPASPLLYVTARLARDGSRECLLGPGGSVGERGDWQLEEAVAQDAFERIVKELIKAARRSPDDRTWAPAHDWIPGLLRRLLIELNTEHARALSWLMTAWRTALAGAEMCKLGYSRSLRRIGTATLLTSQTFTQRYQYACDWRTIACEPQTVALLGDGDDVYWQFEGTTVQSYFPSLLGGVPVGSTRTDADTGKSATYRAHAYTFMLAAWLAAGTGTPPQNVVFTLDQGYGIASTELVGYDGKRSTLWFVTMPVGGHPLTVTRLNLNWRSGEPETYAVQYDGEPRGEITQTRRHVGGMDAMATVYRAAEELVFGHLALGDTAPTRQKG
jgi:hypothetical protein